MTRAPHRALSLCVAAVLCLAAAPPPPPAAPPWGPEQRARVKVYCAGPMDNAADFAEMRRIGATLREAGYATYVPVDDGFSLILMYDALARSGRPAAEQEEARYWLMVAVYTLDMFNVLEDCSATIGNVNPFEGKVNPDAGTVVEAVFATAYGRPTVFYKTAPARLLPPGSDRTSGWDNPMVVGLSGDFSLAPSYVASDPAELLARLDRACAAAGPLVRRGSHEQFASSTPLDAMPPAVRQAVALGAQVDVLKRRFRGRPLTEALALEQVDAVLTLLRREGPTHGVPAWKPVPLPTAQR